MFFTRKYLFLLLISIPYFSYGQENFTGFWQPQLAINYKVGTNYSHNFSLASRNYWYRGASFELSSRQLDLVHFSKFETRDNQSLGLGIQYRLRETFAAGSENELRLTQQYNITSRPNIIRYGHRFRVEQRITASQTIFRFRYRLALDSPLQGEKLDIGEPYVIGSMESLLSIAKGLNPEIDQRFSFQIGWLLSARTKLQGGIEYRFEDYTSETQNVLFVLTSMVLSL